jgi:hypothetical protein
MTLRALLCGVVAASAFAGGYIGVAHAQVAVSAAKPAENGPRWFGGARSPQEANQPGPADPKISIHAKQGKAYGDAVAALPDWNGVWGIKNELATGVFDPATAENVHDNIEGADFGVAAGGREHPPYTPEYEKIYTEKVRKAKDNGFNDDYVSFCRPQGFPRWYANPGAWDMILTPKVIFWVMGEQGNIRRIYMDGRKFPTPDTAYPMDQGFSVGHWEGDTLVIETQDMMAGSYDQSGAPYSDKLHVMERIHMLPSGELQADITLDDPGVLAHTWRVTRYISRVPLDPEIAAIKGPGPNYQTNIGNYCSGNRNVADSKGNQSVLLPGEQPASRNGK